MFVCEKCGGTYATDGFCPKCDRGEEGKGGGVKQVFCLYCGKQIAVTDPVCMGCGCRNVAYVAPAPKPQSQRQWDAVSMQVEKAARPRAGKVALITILSLAAVAVLVLAVVSVYRLIRATTVREALEGETFVFDTYEGYAYTRTELQFFKSGKCELRQGYLSVGDTTPTEEDTYAFSVVIEGENLYVVLEGADLKNKRYHISLNDDGDIRYLRNEYTKARYLAE